MAPALRRQIGPCAERALAGAAADTGAPSSRSMTTSRGIAIAGGQAFGVAYLLDGATHNNVFDGFNMPLPFPDALQEFRVETSSQNAQNGLHAGGTVSVVTKSGTNAFHGDLFEFAAGGPGDAHALLDPTGHLRGDHAEWLADPAHLEAWARAALETANLQHEAAAATAPRLVGTVHSGVALAMVFWLKWSTLRVLGVCAALGLLVTLLS